MGNGRGWLLAVTAPWILLGLLPLALLTSSSISLSDQTISDEVGGRVKTTADVSKVVVQQQMDSLKQLLAAFAQRPGVRETVTAGEPAVREALPGYRRELADMRVGISGVIVVSAEGDMIGAEPSSGLPQDVTGTDWYPAVRNQHRVYVSQAYTPPVMAASRAVAVAAPIMSEDGGRLLGVLAAVYSLTAIQNFATEAANAQDIRLLITDQAGVLVADQHAQPDTLVSLREDPRIDTALAGRDVFSPAHRGFDGLVLSASRPIPGIGWTVTAEVPRAEALASAERLKTSILSVAALLTVLILSGLGLQLHTTRGRRRAQQALAGYAAALATARDEAVGASVAKSEFLAKISHEIRTPINGVLGMNALMLGTRLDDEQRHYATTAHASAQDVIRLLDDFLDLSRIEAGHLAVEQEIIDLPRLCDEVVAPFAPHAHQQGLWLTLRLADDIPQQVVGDSARLRQVLTNVVGNALKFTLQGGVDLKVTLDEGGEYDRVTLRFTVTDTGVGVPPADRERVFGIFRQVDSPITRRTGGSGLGLAISRQLTELMGGRIGLDSVEGVGSKFWVTLPVDVRSWSAPAAEELSGKRVLVAGGPMERRTPTGRILADAGLAVEEAADTSAVLAALRGAALADRPFDLAVVDLDLAAPDPGRSLADVILTDPLLHATAVVVIVTPGRSGYPWPTEVERTVQSVTRPVSRRRLLAAVQNAARAAEPYDSHSVAGPAPGPGARILIAEDDAVSRELAMIVLRRAGHQIDVVEDGRQAVRAVLLGDYDLVFMDCQLPVLDGLAATAEIRGEGSRTPIIAMTAAAMPGDRVRCLEAGMEDHLTKPVDWSYVLAQIPVWTAGSSLPPELAGLDADDLADIARAFLDTAGDTLDRMERATRTGELDQVAALAHRLKGSCATVGARAAAELCAELEGFAAEGAARLDLIGELAEEVDVASRGIIRFSSP
ncbi:hypothetical protein Misp01_77870 [Microtetraspora sp. NBRC 13810]|uniref:hybrid sensor histidine kinase/response regulator n=1 Tax=Microtetraspora sp. NBRC 13810 TaxID=3030990 RepID=UPI0024A1D517|nr:hybrid sensor histidine kinase/response regulator [Microtetraspora sp. NBRC 13810]GLW12659.1 hypothetical protein Misp01_77870 [Microtetraspora sp. NBRC 13810]